MLTVTREHRREVVHLELKAWRYTQAFSDLLAFADLTHPAVTEAPNATLVGKLAACAVTGRGRVTARSDADVGIVDPYGKRAPAYATVTMPVGDPRPSLPNAARGSPIPEVFLKAFDIVLPSGMTTTLQVYYGNHSADPKDRLMTLSETYDRD